MDIESAKDRLHRFRTSTARLREARYEYHRELMELCELTGGRDGGLLRKMETAFRECEELEEASMEFCRELERILEESARLIPPQGP